MKLTNLIYAIVLIVCLATSAKGQIPLEVQTDLIYPYPTQYSVWLSESESFMVTVFNNSDQEFNFFIRTQLEGTDYNLDETYIRFSDTYRPSSGFKLGPGEVRTFSSFDIQSTYSNIAPNDVEYSSNIDIEDPNGELPTGEYRICTQVVEFDPDPNEDAALLSPINCSDFFTAGQAAIKLEFPNEFSPLYPDVPVVFTWFASGIDFQDANNYTYRLNIYEVNSITAAEESVYDLVAEGSANLFYSSPETNLTEYTLDQSLGAPPLVEGLTYAAQVEVIETNGTYFDNGNKSNINLYTCDPFIWNDEEVEDQITENQEDCFQNCHFTLDGNSSRLTIDAPEQILVGHFTMDNIDISNHSNGFYSGTGRIQIPWLNDVFVKVTFQNIEVNSDGRMIGGTFTGDQAPDTPYILEQFNNFIGSTRLVAGLAGSDATLDLPLGINQSIGGTELLIAITEITWTATTCLVNTACNFNMPALGPDTWISLESTETCMHPGGFGNEFVMHMGPDLPISMQGDISLQFKGSESDDVEDVKQNATYLEMDCNGLKSISIKADIFFPEGTLIPDSDDGSPGEGQVRGELGFTIDRAVDQDENVYAVLGGEEDVPFESGLHFLAKIEIDAFQFKGLEGWGFEIEEAWIDASEVSNVPNIVMPEDHSDIVDGELVKMWTGFYLEKGKIACPKEFLGDAGRVNAQINHGIIDPLFSMNVSVNDLLFPIDEGNVDGWALSMDSLFITIEENALVEGGFSGQLGIPITEEQEYLRYSALISESYYEDGSPIQYIFNVTPEDNISFPFLLADGEILENSYVEGRLQPGNPEGTFFETYLAGRLSISTEAFSKNSKYKNIDFIPMELPLVDFAFKYNSNDGFSEEYFALLGGAELSDGENQDAQNSFDFSGTNYGIEQREEKLAGLPLSVSRMSIENIDGSNFDFVIEPIVSLSPGRSGFSLEALVSVKSSLEGRSIKNLKLKKAQVRGGDISANAFGLDFDGSLEFYNTKGNNDVGDKGVKGAITVILPIGVGVKLAAEFGSTTSDPSAQWNSSANYPYWYFDGMAYFGEFGGMPIAPPISLYGIGGGISYNMSRSVYSDNPQTRKNQLADDMAEVNIASEIADGNNIDIAKVRRTSQAPSPRFGSYGLKMAATIGTWPTAALFNMDVALTAECSIAENFRLSLLSIDGDAFLMTPLSQRDKAQVWAGVGFRFENPSQGNFSFDGEIDAYVDVRPLPNVSILRGTQGDNYVGNASFHASNFGGKNGKGSWYLHVGNPEEKEYFGLEAGFDGLAELSAEGYFMLGHGLPADLPMHPSIADLFGETNKEGGNKLTSGTINTTVSRNSSSIRQSKNAAGLALGFQAEASAGVRGFGVYAELTVFLGLDLSIVNSPGYYCGNTGQERGVNGWYGQGRIYGGLEGALGFYVRAFGKDHDLRLFA